MKKIVVGVWVAAFLFVLFESWRVGPWKGEPKPSFWQMFPGPGALFKVDFPDTPAQFNIDMNAWAGEFPDRRPRLAQWMSARGGNRADFYMAGQFDFGDYSFNLSDGEKTARQGLRVALMQLEERIGQRGIKIVGEGEVANGRILDGREVYLDIPGPGIIYPRRLRGRAWVVPRGQVLYFAIAVTPTNKGYDKHVSHFFESFSLL